MNNSHEDRVPADLQHVVEMLREQRPEASPLELDRIKLRAKARGARTQPSFATRQKGLTMMRSRIAVTSMLTLGVFMSGTGATLAVSGISGSAASAQYGTPPKAEEVKTIQPLGTPQPAPVPAPAAAPQVVPPAATVTPQPQVLGETAVEEAEPAAEAATPAPKADVAPAASPAQPARQVAVADASPTLPFTGFAAIPVLLGGIALTGSGLVLRRKGRKLDA